MKNEKIVKQHAENGEWTNNVAFYNDELRIMEGRLSEIASRNTSQEVLKQVERFQNQIIIQKNRLAELKHGINISEDALKNEIKKNSTAISHRKTADHSEARENMQTFEKIFVPFKGEFNRFVGDNL